MQKVHAHHCRYPTRWMSPMTWVRYRVNQRPLKSGCRKMMTYPTLFLQNLRMQCFIGIVHKSRSAARGIVRLSRTGRGHFGQGNGFALSPTHSRKRSRGNALGLYDGSMG